ncbi:MAG: hypothetical protein K8R69_02380, partial [Deltaproteobacteria bacterium]|nr:hypothetical protein [Deltaproteobacteria bacterium]
MTSRWRYQTYFAVFLTILSIYLLVPSVLNFQKVRELAEKQGADLPWYFSFFPDKQINLGLDLQGGIYLELEVNVDEALVHRSEIISSEIERFLKEKTIGYQRVSVVPKTSKIEIFLDKPDDMVVLRNHIKDLYGNTLKEMDQAPVLNFHLKTEGEEAGLAKFQAVLEWAKTQPKILEIDRYKNDLQVVPVTSGDSGEVESAVLTSFGGDLEKIQPPAAVYLALSEVYQNRLKDETLKQAVETIRNRIDRHGVAEPDIRRLGDNRVVVELPGVSDPDRAIGLVKRAGKLEFKLIDETMNDAQVREMVEKARVDNKIPSGFTEEVVAQI